MKSNLKPKKNRRWLRNMIITLVLVVIGGLAGCALAMPREIRQIEKDNHAAAAALQAELPGAFHDLAGNGRSIHYVAVGADKTKPLILFIHGSPGDWTAWARYLNDATLRQRARMMAVDRPGFGGSGGGLVERSLGRQSAEIAPLLEQAAPGQKVIVVGHSYGGPVAVRLGMDYPGKVTDLIILAGAVDPGQEHTMWYQYPADWWPITRVLPGALVVANREIRALKGELTDMLPRWSGLTQRVSILQGDQDDLVPPANADFAEQHLTHAAALQVIRIPGMNHFIPWTKYDLVKAELLKHLDAGADPAAPGVSGGRLQ